MERGLFGFIIRYSKREQLLIVPLVILSMVVLFASLDLPKTIVNEPIQGKRFPNPESTWDDMIEACKIIKEKTDNWCLASAHPQAWSIYVPWIVGHGGSLSAALENH